MAGLVSATALAATPEAPVTLPVKSVGATSTVFGVELNPKAKVASPVEYDLVYQLSSNECAPGTAFPEPPPMAGGVPKKARTLAVSGLEPNAPYAVCARGLNGEGQGASGGVALFKTKADQPLTDQPLIDSVNAANVTSSGATLEAQINPNNQETRFLFEYSTKGSVGGALEGTIDTVEGSPSLPPSFGDQTASAPRLGSLLPGTTYYYRAKATNSAGTATSPVTLFTTVPAPTTEMATSLTATEAALHGSFILTKPTATQYWFSYAKGSACTGGAANTTPPVEAGEGTTQAPASTVVRDLAPDSEYTYCLIAANVYGSEVGASVHFTTPVAPPKIASESALAVTSTSAELQAEIMPGGAATTYSFEYGTTTAYGHSTAANPLPGEGTLPPLATTQIQGLEPDTVYHYRVRAFNSASGPGGEPGNDERFVTQPASVPTNLPDGRRWELVTPAAKHGAAVSPIIREGAAIQASEDGTAIVYATTAPLVRGVEGNRAPEPVQQLSRETNGMWTTESLSAPNEETAEFHVGEGPELRLLSSDLGLALVNPRSPVALAPGVTEQDLYLRAPGPPATYTPLIDKSNALPSVHTKAVTLEGATEDLRHVVVRTSEDLTNEAGRPLPPFGNDLYEWEAGRLSLISRLPDGRAAGEAGLDAFLGSGEGRQRTNTILDEGNRVVWSAGATELFMTDRHAEKTVRLDVVQGGAGGRSEGIQFLYANPEGTRVFFSSARQLTPNSNAGPNSYNIYVAEVDASPTMGVRVTDLTPRGEPATEPEKTGISIDSVLVGESRDGTTVYLETANPLTARSEPSNCYYQQSDTETCPLYRLHYAGGAWTASLVAELSGVDTPDNEVKPGRHVAVASPDGEWLAFMSMRRITGYDNRDARSGVPDEEVFLYDARTGSTACVSCDPTGARPVGIHDQEFPGLLIDGPEVWHYYPWIAATLPGSTPIDAQSADYRSRVLSDSGRLFFNSVGALVPADGNGYADVYEYEPAGVGSCSPPAGAPGCVGLLSGGTANSESAFLDASATGEDVFFLTPARLARADTDNALDVYDAHVCSAARPCPEQIALAPACESADGCRAAQASQPGIFGPSGSATFVGPGNPTSGHARPVQRAKTLAAKLRACRRGPRRRRRHCEFLARHHYRQTGRRASLPGVAARRAK